MSEFTPSPAAAWLEGLRDKADDAHDLASSAATPADVSTAEAAANSYTDSVASDLTFDIDTNLPLSAPLDVPIFDEGEHSVWEHVAHPDVLHFPDGWNGYKFWMAYTPVPDDREPVHIAASNDGVNWEVPPGGPLPLTPYSELDTGFDYFSDPDLVMLDADTMAVYYRATDSGAAARVYRKTTTDGSTWSSATQVIEVASSGTLASPAVVREDDDSFTMWAINTEADARSRTERRTSADGLTWSAPSTCTLPSSATFGEKHIDVILHDGVYHTLIMSTASRLFYLFSTDGVTWEGPTDKPFPKVAGGFDEAGHYRSSLLPSPSRPGRFDVYLTLVPVGTYDQRFGLVRGVDLFRQAQVEDRIGSLETGSGVVHIPAHTMEDSAGTPERGTASGGNVHGWLLDDNSVEQVNAIVSVPTGWDTVAIELLWATVSATAAGDVRWEVKNDRLVDGEGLAVAGPSAAATAAAPSTSNTFRRTTVMTGTTVTDGQLLFKVLRRGNHANDTKSGDVILLGARIVRE